MATLTDMVDWLWVDYLREKDKDEYSEYEDTLFQIIWSITDPKTSLSSIRRAIDRVDGKQPDNVRVEYPKFYMQYPNVKDTARLIGGPVDDTPAIIAPAPEMATAGIRGAIRQVSSQPRGTALRVLELAKRMIEDPDASYSAQLKVKEVIAAALIVLSKTKQSAMDELLDQIDGKVAVTYKLLGDDVYMISYSDTAPAGGQLDEDGVYFIESQNVTDSWAARLASESTKKG